PAGGQRVDHQCTGVGRGDEEQRDQHHGDGGNDSGQRQLLEQFEQGNGVIRLYLVDQLGRALVDDQGERSIAEYREPEEGEDGGDQHHPEDKLANGPPAADLGDEQPDEGGPGDGPAEDEQRPVADPVTARIGLQIEGPFDDVVQIAAGVLQEGFQNEDGRPDEKHEQHQPGGRYHVDQGQVLDATVHASDHRAHGQHGDARDAGDLNAGAHGNRRPQIIEPGVDLRYRQPESGGNAEHGAENREGIHRMANRSMDALADQRIQR